MQAINAPHEPRSPSPTNWKGDDDDGDATRIYDIAERNLLDGSASAWCMARSWLNIAQNV
jgi:adenosylmethionine-8-amino-7-oxononanoate aminotransferase